MQNRIVTIFALLLSLNLSTLVYADAPARGAAVTEDGEVPRFAGEHFARTELYFGTARADNQPPVSEAEFQKFLDFYITPAFPDGLTLLKGLGQFRGADDVAIEEDSFLVILLYPAAARRESSKKIEQIRQDYKDMFEQESVLRSDFCCERVGF
jgi:hypothetical protein